MKGRSNRLPISDPPDDWVNGSWTVDCICGVNFDDGEEMVNCDECGVWVHTRCSRFVRGEKSFACDKCKNKASRNDSEETEVAQLLVELPTKTIKLIDNPPSRRPYKLWTDRPIEQRVHSQGIPGGDPSLFQGLSSIFTSELWKCSGYIPKKFNFCYREFPCWDKQQHITAKSEQDTVDKGAGVLYSLSKQTVVVNVRSQVKAGDSEKKASKDDKLEVDDSKELMNKQKLRPLVLQCGKRSREDLIPSKDRNGKKKTKLLHKEQGSKRDKVHASKTDAIHATSSRQVEVCDGKALKVIKADAPDDKHGPEQDAGLREFATNARPSGISNMEKPENYAATDERNLAPRSSEMSGLGCSSDERIKAEKLSQDAFERVNKTAKTEVVPLPSSENDAVVNTFMKKEGLSLNDVVTNQGAVADPPIHDALKLRSSVEDLANAALEMKDMEIQKNLGTNMLLKSPYSSSKIKSDANLDHLKGVLRSRLSNVANLDEMKDLNEQTFGTGHELDDYQENETTAPSCQSFEHEGDKGIEVSGCQYERIGETTGNPCNSKLECESSESLIEIPKIPSESNEIPCVVGEMSNMIESISPSPSIMLAEKSSPSSSTIVISRSSISDKNKRGHLQNPSYTCKRMISNSSLSTKKETAFVDAIKDEDKHEKTKITVKDNQKSSLNYILKASQSSQASSPVFKQCTSVGKDSLKHPSSKSVSADSYLVPSGIGELAASLQTQHALSVQSRNVAPAGPHRGEKVSQSNLQSSKSAQSSLANPPASSNSPAGLSDEELALLLHQELNSSPRVPRVPRVRHVGSLPQLSSVSASSTLMKRASSSGGKDQQMISRRKSKDAHKDGSRGCREQDNEARKVDRVPSSPDSGKISDALTQAEANSELLHSAENNVESISTSAANSGPSSNNASEQKFSSSQDVLANNPEYDTGTTKGIAPTHRTLPGLIAEIMSKGKRMTYEQLCNAVLPHWQNLRKHNGERYAYSSHSQAVLDCLRNRSEWAQLVDRGPKTNASRKKRKIDAEPSNMESEDGEDRILNDGESKSLESNKEDFPKRRRNARKRTKVALQGRHIKDDRKRRKVQADTDDSGSSSNAREGSVSSDDESQGSDMFMTKSEVSASTDG